MPDEMIVPLIMATAFTAGGYLIHRLERHAASVERSLTMALMCLTAFAFVVMLGLYAEEMHAHAQPAALMPLEKE